MYFAHSVEGRSTEDWQPLSGHLTQVADLAAEFAAPLGLEKAARIAGLLHDLGKYTAAFQKRLSGGERVDHSTAGAWVLRDLVAGGKPSDRMMAEVIGYAILGHHAGLPDRIGDGSLSMRLDGFKPGALDGTWRNELAFDLAGLIPNIPPPPKEWRDFTLSFVGRMLFSCLVDADYRDTESFYDKFEGTERDRVWPALPDILPDLIGKFDRAMADKAATSKDTAVNRLRGEILTHVRERAALKPGLFTLTVPTGGGKTLASLGFALDHAARNGHRRIIYAIPFTSIIDQTAKIFRDVLGEDVILEHHSAIEEEKFDQLARNDKADRLERREKLRLAMEDWAAPIVVTTNVQLFESLFAARPSRCRKLHNIAKSIIILDEAQTLPRPLMIPCARAIDELARTYGCTIVLCTATQPALDECDLRAGHPLGLKLQGRELAPDPARLARELKRVTVRRSGVMSNEDLITALADAPQGLVIVNSRRHALELYKQAKDAGLDGLVHLTTRQHATDRRAILATVRQSLIDETPCRVIATSLVEAGVDVDFPRVWRAEAGLDQIAQAAGRCNREGKRPINESIVTVFSAPDYPVPKQIRDLVGDMGRMANKHADDLLSPDAIRDFFGEMIWRMDDALDSKKIMQKFRLSGAETDFAYRSVAEAFRMIDSTMEPVIIADTDHAKDWVDKLRLKEISSGRIARELQSCVVQVPPQARRLLIANGHVAFVAPELRGDQFAVLKQGSSLYTAELGLIWENAEYLSIENSIL